jgi:hypothetical protein
MPIDPRISLGVQPLQVADPMAQYGQMQNILAAKSQQQMSQMQLENMQRDRDALTKMQAEITKNGGPSDLGAASEQMIKSGISHYMDLGFKIQERLQNQKNFEGLLKGGAAPTAMPSVAPAPGALGSGTFDPNAAPTANKLAPTATPTAAPVNQLSPDTANLRRQIDAAYALGTPQALAWAQAREKELAELTKPQIAPDAVLMKQLGYPLTQAGYQAFRDAQRQERMLSPEEERQKVRIAAASRPPAQPPQPQPPVPVVGPDGKQIYVTREEALAKRMTPASAMEGLAPKEIQAREAKFPAATSAVKTFESSAEKLAADLERLATHPGLSGISGLIYGRTPAVTKDARAAQALYDSIVARGGFQELQNMRASSPTGGALGNVSNQEGQYLRDAFAPINRTQDTADLSRSLTEAANATRSSKQRVREAYDMTYDYKNQGGAVTSPVSSGGKIVDFGSLK